MNLSPERMQELTKFFELVVAMQYDEYLEYFKLNE
jgi:hypothetical protein